MSISALTLYITAARCLQGTAQSGQEQLMAKSFHCLGNTCRPCCAATCSTSGSSSRLSNLEIITGFALSVSVNRFISAAENDGTVMATSYGRGCEPCTLAVILFPLISMLFTAPLLAYELPRGRRLLKSIFERELSHCSPHHVFPKFFAILRFI